MNNTNPKPVIGLVGGIGAGKSTVGRRIADHYELPFMDMDEELERRTGVSVSLIFEVEGDGSRGERPADIPEFANIQIEVILPPERAEELLHRLEKEFFARYAMIAFESDVRVLRANKF